MVYPSTQVFHNYIFSEHFTMHFDNYPLERFTKGIHLKHKAVNIFFVFLFSVMLSKWPRMNRFYSNIQFLIWIYT